MKSRRESNLIRSIPSTLPANDLVEVTIRAESRGNYSRSHCFWTILLNQFRFFTTDKLEKNEQFNLSTTGQSQVEEVQLRCSEIEGFQQAVEIDFIWATMVHLMISTGWYNNAPASFELSRAAY